MKIKVLALIPDSVYLSLCPPCACSEQPTLLITPKQGPRVGRVDLSWTQSSMSALARLLSSLSRAISRKKMTTL